MRQTLQSYRDKQGIKRSKMTEAISEKLDNVLKAIKVLTERMNNYEDGGKLDNTLKSIEGLNQRMDIFDNKIDSRVAADSR